MASVRDHPIISLIKRRSVTPLLCDPLFSLLDELALTATAAKTKAGANEECDEVDKELVEELGGVEDSCVGVGLDQADPDVV